MTGNRSVGGESMYILYVERRALCSTLGGSRIEHDIYSFLVATVAALPSAYPSWHMVSETGLALFVVWLLSLQLRFFPSLFPFPAHVQFNGSLAYLTLLYCAVCACTMIRGGGIYCAYLQYGFANWISIFAPGLKVAGTWTLPFFSLTPPSPDPVRSLLSLLRFTFHLLTSIADMLEGM